MKHILKTWPQFFEKVLSGDKTFEIRENDRSFKVNDELVLKEWEPDKEKFTGREVTKTVTYMTTFAQNQNYVVMALGSKDLTLAMNVALGALYEIKSRNIPGGAAAVFDIAEEAIREIDNINKRGSNGSYL